MLLAIIYFFDSQNIIAAAAPAVLVHELGHVLSMRLFGAYPTVLNATLSGFSLDYSGTVTLRQEALTALSGPVCGILFALFCARLGAILDSEYLTMCAGLGFVLNCFNLLPALPLDGGRALHRLLERFCAANAARVLMLWLGGGVAVSLCALGLYLLVVGKGAALLLAGIWLLLLQRNSL